ncbi:hypothetical protein Vadar_012515 [Vaccinium darrowii]|uniref:Uncharacterized protein n=1 Tax=Vaccinium darrowii TaxID=229202 RepID=A0ACB7YD32_9ERIC|nr:hypothetical protein Vadar_012515 [Vaccinium darrowii]
MSTWYQVSASDIQYPKDVEDLRSMVGEVVNLFPEQIALWTLFHTGAIYRRPAAQVLDLWTVKKVALYNYSHPIFLNKARSCNFVYKLHEIRRRRIARFNRDVRLNATQRDSDMSNWLQRVTSLPPNSPLRSVLYDPNNRNFIQPRYRHSFEFPLYMRVVCEHGRDRNPRAWAGEVFRKLREVFPDGLPKIHLQLCTKLNVDGHCVPHYGADIFRLIGHGPHGYPGFRISLCHIQAYITVELCDTSSPYLMQLVNKVARTSPIQEYRVGVII